ncbi:hypothetical protein ABT187_45260 [Streptomyces sp. NPDC001817]|uniref:hypothetical protein n=1 Tax=Streptomyces sp. NPDC001817 TaxID=3154398 RepID=UPI003328ADC1
MAADTELFQHCGGGALAHSVISVMIQAPETTAQAQTSSKPIRGYHRPRRDRGVGYALEVDARAAGAVRVNGPSFTGMAKIGRMEQQARDLNVINCHTRPDDHRSRAYCCYHVNSRPTRMIYALPELATALEQ